MKTETEYYDEANELIITEKLDEALEIINEGLSVYPDSAKLYYNNGHIFFETEDFKKAIFYFELAIQKDPNFDKPEDGLGHLYSRLGNYEKALRHFQLCLQKNSLYAYLEKSPVKMFDKQGDYREAIEYYNLAIQKYPHNAVPEYGLGNVYAEQKKYVEAIRHYNLAIQKDPNLAIPEYDLGNVYAEQKKYVDAIRHYNRAIKKNPYEAAPENGLGNVYAEQKKYVEAIRHYNRAIKKNLYDAVPENGLGNVYAEQKKYVEAIRHYNRAIKKDPYDAAPEYGLGRVYRMQQKFKEAIWHLNLAIYKMPNFSWPETELGGVYTDQKKYEQAIEHFNLAIQKDPNSAAPENGLGYVFHDLKEFGKAKIHYTRFVFLDKDNKIRHNLRRILSFFMDEMPSPFLARYILGKNAFVLLELNSFYIRNQAQCEVVQLYLDYLRFYRVGEQNQLAFAYTQALTNYFMGLPFEAYHIFDDEIDLSEEGISMLGNYYWLLAATAFAVPESNYQILKQNALDEIEDLLDSSDDAPARELYYAGQIYWNEYQANQLPKMANLANRLFGLSQEKDFLPAIYMRAVTLGALDELDEQAQQIDLIKTLEDSNADGPIYLEGSQKTILDPEADDFLAPILHYAHFVELYEAIELVNGRARVVIPEFYSTWEFSKKEYIKAKVNTAQLKELKNSLVNTLVENAGEIYDDMKAETLRESISDIHNTLENSIHRLFGRWEGLKKEDGYSTPLEYNLATFIHGWETGNAIIHEGKKVAGRIIYEKFIAYFLLKGVLEPLAAFSLTYYAFFIEERHQPGRLFSVFSDSSAEGVTDLGKESLANVGKIVITTTFDMGMVSLSPVTFLVGFTIKAILQHRALFMANCSPKDSAKDDYNKFKEILDENTLELVKAYQPKDEDEQSAWEQICGWYDKRQVS